MLFLDSKFFLTDHNLNYTDKMSMAAGVEVRVPFLDPDLMRFAARLPINLKQRGSVGKWIFKRAMESHLPRDVIYRPKTGFGVPLRDLMQNELKASMDESLLHRHCNDGVFNLEGINRLIQHDRSGELDASYPLFEVLCIKTWMRLFSSTV
jgi:asparagine synthase (glutamine-hydrolysing)